MKNIRIGNIEYKDAVSLDGEEYEEIVRWYPNSYYGSEERMKCAKEYASDEHVINVSVMAGEYQTEGGDVYGEPEAVYTVSNKDEETTAIAREKANYVSKYVDGYATDGEERIPKLAKIKDDELKSKSTKDAEITAG